MSNTKQITLKIPVQFEAEAVERLLSFLSEYEVFNFIEAVEITEYYSVTFQSSENMGVDNNSFYRMRQLKYAIGQLEPTAPDFYKKQL